MGNCIICGTSTDGPICETHQEDVVFEFRGTRPGQLTEGRFYRGIVDGYAEFGVFVNLSDRVTGLLHRSKLKRRLESLDWEVGDEVFVQVTNIRDNGDVDLGWSIRQSERDFRGSLIDTPEGDRLADEEADEGNATEASTDAATPEPEPEPEVIEEAEPEPELEPEPEPEVIEEAEPEPEPEATPAVAERERVTVDSLRDHVGEVVRLEGEIASARQTSGPTVFELRDETGIVDAAAFVEAGVRAYPEVDAGAVVRLDGEVRVRRDELQMETESLVVLENGEREAVADRMQAALDAEAAPTTDELFAEDAAVAAVSEDLAAAARAIRRAVFEARPVVVRHPATADGYAAGAAIERAVLPLIAEEHAQSDAAYHYFDRRPLEGDVYDMDDATKDLTNMLGSRERHDEKLPLVVFAGAGGTADSRDGLDLLGIYGVERLLVDGAPVDEEAAAAAETAVAPDEVRTATVVAATLARFVNDDVSDDLRHLPAVSYWEDTPEQYVTLAEDAGVSQADATALREAIALEAYYQSYEDKRELIIDLLFDRELGLAQQVAAQFNEKLDAELQTAEANLELRAVDGETVAVLDTDAYTHRFDFPTTALLLDVLHRRHRDEAAVTVGVADDELYLRTEEDLDIRTVAGAVRERVPNGGVSARGSRAGAIEFLVGERDAVVEAVIEVVGERLTAPA
jgi:RecJ-like exonuclease